MVLKKKTYHDRANSPNEQKLVILPTVSTGGLIAGRMCLFYNNGCTLEVRIDVVKGTGI